MTEPRALAPPSILVDGHVHVYASYDDATFLNSAVENFRRGAAALRFDPDSCGHLFLTETHDQHVFRRWRDRAGREFAGGWRFTTTEEDCSLLAYHNERLRLVVIGGRQIATREGLEVLACGHSGDFPGQMTFEEAIAAARTAAIPPVIPWGFGKWTFARGRMVRAVLEQSARPLFLGDNGGRWSLGPQPSEFRAARMQGVYVLPGSDPLPLRAQQERVGSYGFALHGQLDASRPAGTLRGLLLNLKAQPPAFGRLTSTLPFLRNQLAMQLRKQRTVA